MGLEWGAVRVELRPGQRTHTRNTKEKGREGAWQRSGVFTRRRQLAWVCGRGAHQWRAHLQPRGHGAGGAEVLGHGVQHHHVDGAPVK